MDDDPARIDVQAPHWRRYRRFVAGMVGLAAVTVAVALVVLAATGVALRPAVVGAVAAGVGGTLVLAGALMGLVFASAAGGHDDAVDDHAKKQGRPAGRPWRQ